MELSSFFRGKKVLVTGAAGFVGTNLVKKLADFGAEVTGTLNRYEPQRKTQGVRYVKADLTDQKTCLKVCADMDYVFMAAANSSGAEVMEKTPLVHLTPNVVMNAYMLAAAYEVGVDKFCFISSNTVYPVTDFPVKESDVDFTLFEKYFVVGWMKQFSEVMCHMYSKNIPKPMPTVVVRPGNLYGPFDKYTRSDSKVIAALVRRAVEGEEPFLVWGDGKDIKDFLYIDDFVDGLVLAFAKQTDPMVTVNIASGEQVTIKDVVTTILNAAGARDPSITYDSSKPSMIPKRLIDITLMKEEFDWRPKTSLIEGIDNTIAWYRSEFKDKTPEERKKYL